MGGTCEPELGSLQSGGEGAQSRGAVVNRLGGLQAPKGVNTEALAGRLGPGNGHATLAGQGGAGKAGCARKGWGALPVAWPRPRRVCQQEAQGTVPGTSARRVGGPHLPCPAP